MHEITKSIIIPFFDCFDLVMQRLAEIAALGPSLDTEVVLVNDGSVEPQTYAMIEAARKQFPFFKLVGFDQNRGFSSANNLGAAESVGEILYFLSSDVKILKSFWEQIVPFDALRTWYGGRYLTHDTGWNTFNGTTFYYLEGWFVVCPRCQFESVGRWDTKFDPHDYEDIDLSLRARRFGYVLQQIPDGFVEHLGYGTIGRKKTMDARQIITNRNRLYFMDKWKEYIYTGRIS